MFEDKKQRRSQREALLLLLSYELNNNAESLESIEVYFDAYYRKRSLERTAPDATYSIMFEQMIKQIDTNQITFTQETWNGSKIELASLLSAHEIHKLTESYKFVFLILVSIQDTESSSETKIGRFHSNLHAAIQKTQEAKSVSEAIALPIEP